MRFPLKKLKSAFKDRALRLAGLDLKAEYVNGAPSPQNSLDIFKGEWASKMPPPFQDLKAGESKLFDDERISWLGEVLGTVSQMRVLECGPLEGGHTYMLEQLGAASILSVEANTRAFLRCLTVKELLGLSRSRFVLGDFVSYLRQGERHDLVIACGVLYHLTNPVEAIALMSKVTDTLYVWTHYYDEAKIKARRILSHHFQEPSSAVHEGYQHSIHRQHYQLRLGNPGFMGATRRVKIFWVRQPDDTIRPYG
jgi:hypothetical protein